LIDSKNLKIRIEPKKMTIRLFNTISELEAAHNELFIRLTYRVISNRGGDDKEDRCRGSKFLHNLGITGFFTDESSCIFDQEQLSPSASEIYVQLNTLLINRGV